MGLHYVGTKSKVKAKKKVGWQKEEDEYKAWMAKHSPNPKLEKELKKNTTLEYKLSTPVGRAPKIEWRTLEVKFPDKEDPIIHDPRVLYKDDPEMLERELKARERKFTTAPIYNKGGDVYVTDEMMKDITAGTTRRR